MKIENISDLHFVLLFIVPGFIYIGSLSHLVPLHRDSDKSIIFLKYISATAINYSISIPIIYNVSLIDNKAVNSLLPFIVLFIIPFILSIIRAYTIQRGVIKKLCDKIGLRVINPIPTGWDWKFSQSKSCFLIITLKNGTEIGGFFSKNSMASSDPNQRDIYIEKVYKIVQDGPWEEVNNSQGMYVSQDQIAYIEFLG